MTIQRQYSLPNCTLVLEGISDPTANGGMAHSLLSVITGFQCYLAGQEKPLSGGRDLLNQLVSTVSEYAQTYLSGIPHRSKLSHDGVGGTAKHSGQSIQIAQVGPTLHRLLIQPQEVHADSPVNSTPAQFDLTTLQLFDLVEAIDQMLADGQTPSDLSLNLVPLPKRHAAVQKPAAQQTVPALLGVAGLAAAAAALFFVPIPEVRRPEPVPNSTSQTQPGASPNASPAAGSSPTPTESPAASPDASPSPDAAASLTEPSPDASPTASPDAAANLEATPEATTESANAATNPAAEAILTSRPEITEPIELERLQVELYDRLDRGWTTEPTFNEELIYRVGVAPSGEVLGFKFANDPALNYVNETPLLDLRYNPSEANSQEPIAQFRVVFKPDGVLEVSPWHGQSPESPLLSPSPLPSPSP
jgi:cytoskeletal protein RodZ